MLMWMIVDSVLNFSTEAKVVHPPSVVWQAKGATQAYHSLSCSLIRHNMDEIAKLLASFFSETLCSLQ